MTDGTSGGVEPSWSPDGEWIAFNNENGTLGDIYLIKPDGTDLRRLTHTADISRDGNLVWSPDGQTIAYSADREGNIEIYILNVAEALNGSEFGNHHQLTSTTSEIGMRNLVSSWSPDGREIIFQSDRDGNFEIYVMNSDGSQPQNLTRHPGRDYVPDWWMPESAIDTTNPPGTKNAFVSVTGSNGEIYLMKADGSDPQRLTNWGLWDGYPSWSPDGTQIAYYSYQNARSWVVMIMNADGSDPHQLTGGGSCDVSPIWSPDGLWIAFSMDASCNARQQQVVVIGIDGQNFHLITQNEADNLNSAWSPDGNQILLVSNLDGDEEIYTMNADGSNLVQLTDNDFSDYMASWSPDGQWIAFVSNQDGNDEIYMMDIYGSNLVRLTNNPAED